MTLIILALHYEDKILAKLYLLQKLILLKKLSN